MIKKCCKDCIHCVLVTYKEAGHFNMGEWFCVKDPPKVQLDGSDKRTFSGLEIYECGIDDVKVNGIDDDIDNVERYVGHPLVEMDSFCNCFKLKNKKLRAKIASLIKQIDD